MVRGSIDLMLSSEQGNSSMVTWTDPKVDAAPIMIEAIFVLESVAPARLHVDRFLPPTPVRVLVDMSQQDCSEGYDQAFINANTRDAQ